MALSWIHYISLAKVSFSIFLNISHTWDYPNGLTCFHRKGMTLSAHLYVIADLWPFSCAKVRTADDCIKNHSYFAIPAWLFRQPSAFFLQKKWVFQKTHWEFLATGILWRSVCIAQEKGIQRQRCTDDSGHKNLSGVKKKDWRKQRSSASYETR